MSGAPGLIVCGARVHGVPGADAVAVLGDRIAAVGARRDVLALRGPATHVVDRPRALVCAGFHDAHAHLLSLVEARAETDLHGMDVAQIADAVARAAAARPGDRWVVGRGYDPELFRGAETTPRALLDTAAPGRLVLLRSHDWHSVALSGAALERTGFASDPGAAATGVLRETAAAAASVQCADLGDAELARGAIEACFGLARAGITAIHEMSGSRRQRILRELDESGCLPLDVFATLSPEDAAGAETAHALSRPGDRFRVAGMKAFLDGALGSRTAHLLAPYEGEACHCGVEVVAPDRAREMVAAAAAHGLPSFLHAIGDAAVRSALGAFAAGPGLRHRVEHAQMIHDTDLPRFAAQGVAASVQPVHMALDAPLVHRHWGARSHEAFPVRRLLDSGARVAFGSDAPIETFDVLQGIACAVRRTGRDGTPLHPEESVTAAEAIDAYTSGAAWAVSADDEMGTVREGGVASLTLLSEDVAAHPEALADARIAATVVRGRVLHEAPA